MLGIAVSNYEVYVDNGGIANGLVTSNQWTMTAAKGLTASSTHSFPVGYLTTDGRRSSMSPSSSGTTWSGKSWGGIPYEWMTNYYGGNTNLWPPATRMLAGGPSVLNVFLSGGSPLNSRHLAAGPLTRTAQGMFLGWNPQPGLTYQGADESQFDLDRVEQPGRPRFAAGYTDSIYVGGTAAGSTR